MWRGIRVGEKTPGVAIASGRSFFCSTTRTPLPPARAPDLRMKG